MNKMDTMDTILNELGLRRTDGFTKQTITSNE